MSRSLPNGVPIEHASGPFGLLAKWLANVFVEDWWRYGVTLILVSALIGLVAGWLLAEKLNA